MITSDELTDCILWKSRLEFNALMELNPKYASK